MLYLVTWIQWLSRYIPAWGPIYCIWSHGFSGCPGTYLHGGLYTVSGHMDSVVVQVHTCMGAYILYLVTWIQWLSRYIPAWGPIYCIWSHRFSGCPGTYLHGGLYTVSGHMDSVVVQVHTCTGGLYTVSGHQWIVKLSIHTLIGFYTD